MTCTCGHERKFTAVDAIRKVMDTLDTIGNNAYKWSQVEPHLFQHTAYYAKQDLQYALDHLDEENVK